MSDDLAARLLAALRHFRGEDVGLSRDEAGSALAEATDRFVRRALTRYQPLRESSLDDALAHTQEVCLRGRFSGASVGEAVRYIQTIARNAYLDDVQRGPPATEPSEPEPVGGELHDPLLARRALSKLTHLAALLLSHAGKKRRAVEAFLRYRVQGIDELPAGRSAASAYQDRCRGRKYARAIVEELEEGGQLGDEDRELLARLLDAPDVMEQDGDAGALQ